MGNDHRAAGESQQGFFQRPQRFHVEIVGRLVEQQHIAATAQQLGQMHAVAFAAGQILDELLLIRSLEVEAANVGAGTDLIAAHRDQVEAIGDFLPDGLAAVEGIARLIDIGQPDGIADPQRAAIRLFLTDQHAEQGGFAGAVGTDDADDAALGQAEVEAVDQQPVTKALAQAGRFHHEFAQARPRRNVQFLGFVALLEFLRFQFLEAGDTRLALGVATLGIGAHPFQFRLHGLGVRGFLFLLDLQTLFLLFQP